MILLDTSNNDKQHTIEDCLIVDDLAVDFNTLFVTFLVERIKALRVKLMSWMRQLCWSSRKC